MKKVSRSAVVVLVTLTCMACGTSSDATSGTAPSKTPSKGPESVATNGPTASSLVLGPHGVGPLQLGMTHQEVVNTHAAQAPLGSRHDGWRVGCRVLQYRPERLGRTPGDTLNGVLSAHQGLERMYATWRMVTPEGVHLGSTLNELREAYDRPNLQTGDLVTVRASPEAVYRIQVGAVVSSISLEMRRLDCTI